MIIGVPKEIKQNEFRVSIVPENVASLCKDGHKVLVETKAGQGIGISDLNYKKAGAIICEHVDEIFSKAQMIVKVKEPQESEYKKLKKGQIIFTYLHLAPDPEQTVGLLNSGCMAIAYETVTDEKGGLPLLTPMSEIAGKLSTQVGASCLEKHHGGLGKLLSGAAGVLPAKVVIIGGGVVGTNAAKIASGMGADVTILDISPERLRELDTIFQGKVKTHFSSRENLIHDLKDADLIIGAVLVPGAAAPKVITKDMLRYMKRGSVMVDVAIDQGGCFETSHPTTHKKPTFKVNGITHYCVTNMPGAVARTSSYALNNSTFPYIKKIADLGLKKALQEDRGLFNGLNIFKGHLTNKEVANAQGIEYTDPEKLIIGM